VKGRVFPLSSALPPLLLLFLNLLFVLFFPPLRAADLVYAQFDVPGFYEFVLF